MTLGSSDQLAAPVPPAIGSRPGRSRRRKGALLGLVLLAVLALVALILAIRYVPYAFQGRTLLNDARALQAEVKSMGMADVNAASLAKLRTNVDGLRGELAPFQDLLANDPLVGVARSLPFTRDQLTGADALVSSGDDLLSAANIALGLGDQFVALRKQQAAGQKGSLLAGMVRLMATSGPSADEVQALLAKAAASLETIPAGAIGTIRDAGATMADPIGKYAPLLDEYRKLDGILPGVLGSGGQKRYLVLAQDPAELRPTGGYNGTFGIVAFKDGNLADHEFHNVYTLDLKKNMPFVPPPQPLIDHLLGDGQSWRLADSNWSPDFPTTAQDALRMYTLESGDANVDGVIGLTTFALDRILSVIGPVEVPAYNVTVHAGEVTLTALGLTRSATDPNTDRKEFLNALASTVLDRLFALPPAQWLPMLTALQGIDQERLLQTWFKDPAAEAYVASSPMAGEVRQDPGDYLYVVEANMAPTSKYNLVVTRRSFLNVAIAADGEVVNTLRLDWQNDAGMAGEPYQSIRSYSTSQDGLYGAYVRVMAPDGSTLLSATGAASQRISGAERVESDAGRAVFANFLLMPPGDAHLTYRWQAPSLVPAADGTWTYQLTIQKQPGMSAEAVSVRVDLPPGATVLSAPDGAQVNGGTVPWSTTLTTDARLTLRYRLP